MLLAISFSLSLSFISFLISLFNLKEEYIKLNANLKEPVTVHLTPRSNKDYVALTDKHDKLNKIYEELKYNVSF
jgi:hypothetical protein